MKEGAQPKKINKNSQPPLTDDSASSSWQKMSTWSFTFVSLLTLILVVFVILQNRKIVDQQDALQKGDSSLEVSAVNEKNLVAARLDVGDIGSPAEHEVLKVNVSKLDCSRYSLEDGSADDQADKSRLEMSRTKWCLVSLMVENVSDKSVDLKDYRFYLETYANAVKLHERYLQPDILYRDSQADSQLLKDLPETLKKSKQVTAVLGFEVGRNYTPDRLVVLGDKEKSMLSVYLDDQSDNYGFKCRKERTVKVGDTFRDCAYEYEYAELDCDQDFKTKDNFSGKVCFAELKAKNISHLADASPYAPNVPYYDIYYAFGNHVPRLQDSKGNLYGRNSYDTSYLEDELSIEYPGSFNKRVDVLEPGDSTTIVLAFLVPVDVEIESLSLRQHFFIYHATTGGSAANSSSAECPTCGRR